MLLLPLSKCFEEWTRIYSYATDVAKASNIEIGINEQAPNSRQRRCPRHLEDSIIYTSIGGENRQGSSTVSHQYKINVYFPIIDTFLAELWLRFNEKNIEIMNAIGSLSPTSSSFLDPEKVNPFAIFYNLDSQLLTMELGLAKHILTNKSLGSSLKDLYLLYKQLSLHSLKL